MQEIHNLGNNNFENVVRIKSLGGRRFYIDAGSIDCLF